MSKNIVFTVFLLILTCVSCAQNKQQDYQGEWIGHLPNKSSFNFKLSLEIVESDSFKLTIANDTISLEENIVATRKDHLRFNIEQQLFFDLKYDENKQAYIGFIKTGKYFYHISLPKVGTDQFVGTWNPFMLNNGLQSDDIMLYVERMEDETLAAYPFFGDQRFRGTWTADFKQQGNTLLFRDTNTGFNFRAELSQETIVLEILLVDTIISAVSLTHTDDGWDYNADPVQQNQNTNTPTPLNDGWATANSSDYGINKSELSRLIDSVNSKVLENTHSVLIAKEHKLVFETYFDGFNVDIPHDLRSASKSISSAIIGIAIDEKIITSVDEQLYDFIPKDYHYTKDSLKSKISIKDLLTMSSGLDVNNLAAEEYYQNPNNPKSWLQSVLEAPMVKEPGTYADYGSANPFLLGVGLNERLDVPLETYMHEKLFAPLGISNYINQTDDIEISPYFGGGMLLTPRDLLKFGQLYLNKGLWNGKQIISEAWVAESFEKHVQLQDAKDKNQYGYLWWHDTYTVDGKAIVSIEARGAGGQFIFILPALETVVVITSGNFRNRKGNQPRTILEEYILPALVH